MYFYLFQTRQSEDNTPSGETNSNTSGGGTMNNTIPVNDNTPPVIDNSNKRPISRKQMNGNVLSYNMCVRVCAYECFMRAYELLTPSIPHSIHYNQLRPNGCPDQQYVSSFDLFGFQI